MAWFPISNTVPQYIDGDTNAPYSGAVLKAYQTGTLTNISMATSNTGATTVDSIALNADGYPEVSGNTVIPHLDQDYKLALYPDQTSADADSGAIWTIDDIYLAVFIKRTSTALVVNESGADVDFRIEGDTDPNLFFVDAGNDRIGIGTNAPTQRLHVREDHDGPTEALVQNANTGGTATIVEHRAINDSGGASFGITGASFNDGSPLAGNEAFVVAESTSVGLNLKNNVTSGGWIRFVSGTGASVVEIARFASTGALLVGHTITASTAVGNVSLPNGAALQALNAAGTDNLPLISLNGNNRTTLHIAEAFLNLDGPATDGTAGAVSKYLRVTEDDGTEYRIPMHAVS